MNNKRKILKGLSVSTVWASPMVASIVLPVHAQTTPGTCVLPLVIPGITNTCADPILDDLPTSFAVDDVTDPNCPVLVSATGPLASLISIQHTAGNLVVGVSYNINSQSGFDTAVCISSGSLGSQTFNLPFETLGGNDWIATFELIRDDFNAVSVRFVSISDIILTPAP